MSKRSALFSLLLLLALTFFLGYKAVSVQFHFNFEKFFPSGDEDTEFFNEHRKLFGTDNDFLLIGLVSGKGIFDQAFLLKADSLIQKLKKASYVTHIHSVVNSTEWIKSTLAKQVYESPLIHIRQPEMYHDDSIRLFSSPLYKGNIVSEDAKAIALLVEHEQYLSKEKCDVLSVEVEELVSKAGFDEFHITGRSIVQRKYVSMMGEEFFFFACTSFVLVVVFLWFTFRTFWGVWIPILVVVISSVWIIGFMGVVGEKLNILLTLLPTIVFVVGMSDAVHILSHYIDELKSGLSKTEALKKAYREVALATFLTSFTTAIGFLTLLISPVEPIRIFGLYTSLGVMIAFLHAYTFLPLLLILMPAPKIKSLEKQRTWYGFLHSSYSWLIRSKYKVITGSLVIGLIGAWGTSMIISNNFLLEDLKPESELRKEFSFFEEKFSGVRPFEMEVFINKKNDTLLYNQFTAFQIQKIENFLLSEYGLKTVFSPNTVIKAINRNLHTCSPEYYVLPEKEEEMVNIISKAEKFHSGEQLRKVITSDGKRIRIYGKCFDSGGKFFRERNELFEKFFRENISPGLDYKITGTATLIDKNSAYLADGMMQGLMLSMAVIALIVGLMYKSWKMVIIAVIPNILPLIMISGLMGFTDINLKVSTSMIFTIAFGIAVDDTIHFISKLKLELASGKSLQYAIKRTYLTTGKAIYVTTIILSGGFLTLVFSGFLGTFYIGLLIGLTLIFAVLGDMILLPVLVMMFYGKKERKKL
ncbi:MAG: efflux RND transporter permease subunit [Bacteroidota bacterium]